MVLPLFLEDLETVKMKALSDKEILERFSDENVIQYKGKRIPQALVDHVPLGLTEKQMHFIEDTERYKLPPEIHRIKKSIIAQVTSVHRSARFSDQQTWRISDFHSKTHKIHFTKAKYSDFVVTNLAAQVGIITDCGQLLYCLEDGRRLRPLKKSRPANHLGVAVIVVTSDIKTFLQRRSRYTLTYPNMLGPSASGTMDGRLTPPNPFEAMRAEIVEELGIEQDEIRDLRYLGLARDLRRAGQPDMFFIAKTTLSLPLVQEHLYSSVGAYETVNLVEIDLADPSQVEGRLHEKEMSPTAMTALYFLFHFLKASKDHL